MENLIEIAVKILAALLAIGITWLTGKAKEYLTIKAEATGNEHLAKLIEQFCEAAEQQLKEDDPTGIKRKAFVCEMLTAAGYEISDIIDAAIEAAVYRINKGA